MHALPIRISSVLLFFLTGFLVGNIPIFSIAYNLNIAGLYNFLFENPTQRAIALSTQLSMIDSCAYSSEDLFGFLPSPFKNLCQKEGNWTIGKAPFSRSTR